MLSTPTRDVVRAAWGGHLASFHWSYFITLTAKTRVCPAVLTREFTHVFVRKLARISQEPIAWFYAVERTALGFPHLHALLDGADAVTASRVKDLWRLGRADVQVYNSGQRGAYYVCKSLGINSTEYDISRRAPRHRVDSAAARPAACRVRGLLTEPDVQQLAA